MSLASCLPSVEFTCENDGDCPGGTCEVVRFCSTADTSCEFGRRFSEHASDNFADKCVDCPEEGLLLDNGRCYAGFRGNVSWDEARLSCINILGDDFHLAHIDDVDENLLLTNRLSDRDFWIGGTDRAEEDVFLWTDNSPVQFFGWAPGEPRNDNGDEDCIVFDSGNGRWEADDCDDENDFLCERR